MSSLCALNTHFWRKCHPPYALCGFCLLSDSRHQILFFILLWFLGHHQWLLLLAVPMRQLLMFICDQRCVDAAVGGRYHHQHTHHSTHHPSDHHCGRRSPHTHRAVALADAVSCWPGWDLVTLGSRWVPGLEIEGVTVSEHLHRDTAKILTIQIRRKGTVGGIYMATYGMTKKDRIEKIK